MGKLQKDLVAHKIGHYTLILAIGVGVWVIENPYACDIAHDIALVANASKLVRVSNVLRNLRYSIYPCV